jgi:hypothetical protein
VPGLALGKNSLKPSPPILKSMAPAASLRCEHRTPPLISNSSRIFCHETFSVHADINVFGDANDLADAREFAQAFKLLERHAKEVVGVIDVTPEKAEAK